MRALLSLGGVMGLVLALPVSSTVARADASLDAGLDSRAKAAWIQSRLEEASGKAMRWQYGWTAFYGVSTLAYAAQAHSLDDPDQTHDRVDARVGAASSLLGLAGMWLEPLTTASNAQTLAMLPASTPGEQEARLHQAETLLRENAEQEQQARSFQAHALTALVSLLSGVAIARDDSRTDDGWLMFAQSMLVGELQIYTAPTDATDAWQAYQRGDFSHGKRPGAQAGALVVSALPEGFALHYRF